MKLASIAAGLALLASSSASAEPPRKGGPGDDSERQICKSKPVIGSRLKRIRECATAAQWADLKLQEQLGLMRKQTNGDPGGVSAGGRDSPW